MRVEGREGDAEQGPLGPVAQRQGGRPAVFAQRPAAAAVDSGQCAMAQVDGGQHDRGPFSAGTGAHMLVHAQRQRWPSLRICRTSFEAALIICHALPYPPLTPPSTAPLPLSNKSHDDSSSHGRAARLASSERGTRRGVECTGRAQDAVGQCRRVDQPVHTA